MATKSTRFEENPMYGVVKESSTELSSETTSSTYRPMKPTVAPPARPKTIKIAGTIKGVTPNQDFSDYERIALFCSIGIAAYIGSYMRIAITFYKIWKIETNYTVMYTQIIGCLIMGFMVKHKANMFDTGSGFSKIMYTGITSGLCGSITTFSTWSMECSKNLFLQGDYSWGNVVSSCNGGRFFEFIVCLWIGVAAPMGALHLGHFLASFSPYTVSRESSTPSSSNIVLSIPIVLFLFLTILIFALPLAPNHNWQLFTYTGIFAVIGAYTRYLLSHWNKSNFTQKHLDNFFIGTFIVNVAGTWLLALFTVLSKFVVDYNDVNSQAVLFSLGIGFCGCLTTVSTFVNEIDGLAAQPKKSYFYAISTNVVAQIGIIFIYLIAAWTSLPHTVVDFPKPINFCTAHDVLCNSMLEQLHCPVLKRVVIGCTGDGNDVNPNYENFVGTCQCVDGLDTQRQVELIIDSQIKYNTSASMVALWPNKESNTVSDPTESYDLCLTYQNVCNHLLNRIQCPANLRKISTCSRKGLYSFQQMCTCGGEMVSDDRVHEVIVDTALFRRYDMFPTTNYVTSQAIDFCSTYSTTCTKLLDHVDCKPSMRTNIGCTSPQNYTTFVGSCLCGTWDPSFRVSEDIYDALVKPSHQLLVTKLDPMLPDNDVLNACDVTGIQILSGNIIKAPTIFQNATTVTNLALPSGTYSIVSLLNNTKKAITDANVTFSLSSNGVSIPLTSLTDGVSLTAPYSIPSVALTQCVDYKLTASPQDVLGSTCSDITTTFRLNPNNVCPSNALLPPTFDTCTSYTALCQSFLDKIGCPLALQANTACDTTPSLKFPNGRVQDLIVTDTVGCVCGTITANSARPLEIVIDAVLGETVSKLYTYIPQPNAPYTLVMSSNPYKQLLYEGFTS